MTGTSFACLCDRFLNNVETKNFEIELGYLICRFGMAENPKNKQRVL